MTDHELVTSVEQFKEELEDHEQKFIESVTEFYLKNNMITEEQRRWFKIYYKRIQESFGEDEELSTKLTDEELLND